MRNTAIIARIIPIICGIVICSLSITYESMTVIAGYNDVNGTINAAGPLCNAFKNKMYPTVPKKPPITATTEPILSGMLSGFIVIIRDIANIMGKMYEKIYVNIQLLRISDEILRNNPHNPHRTTVINENIIQLFTAFPPTL